MLDLKNTQLWKVLNVDLKQKDFQYKIGLNELDGKLDDSGRGLYVSWKPWLFFIHGDLITPVTIPDDADIIVMNDMLRVNKLVLGNPIPISEAKLNWPEAVRENGHALKYVKHQTEEMCLTAVAKHGLALKYVNKQKPSICLAAVTQNGMALAYARVQTPAICIAAVKQNKAALPMVNYMQPLKPYETVWQDPETVDAITDYIKRAGVVNIPNDCYCTSCKKSLFINEGYWKFFRHE